MCTIIMWPTWETNKVGWHKQTHFVSNEIAIYRTERPERWLKLLNDDTIEIQFKIMQ